MCALLVLNRDFVAFIQASGESFDSPERTYVTLQLRLYQQVLASGIHCEKEKKDIRSKNQDAVCQPREKATTWLGAHLQTCPTPFPQSG